MSSKPSGPIANSGPTTWTAPRLPNCNGTSFNGLSVSASRSQCKAERRLPHSRLELLFSRESLAESPSSENLRQNQKPVEWGWGLAGLRQKEMDRELL